MLDLYQAEATLADAIALCEKLVRAFYKGDVGRISIADHIRSNLDIDLYRDPDSERKLLAVLQRRYNTNGSALLFHLVRRYIDEEIESRSRGLCLLVTEYPRVMEPSAKPTAEAIAIADVAEFQINGTEVAQLYEDDPETDAVLLRARAHGHYGPENEVIARLINSGGVPGRSAGFGIGIERLCQACLSLPSIAPFMISSEFIREREGADANVHFQ